MKIEFNNVCFIPDLIEKLPIESLIRIDMGLEGNWNPTVSTIWTREAGFKRFSTSGLSHPIFKPSLELYFPGIWIGLHCFRSDAGQNLFDKNLASEVVNFVEAKLKSTKNI